jgi:hypothetical protein
MTGNTNTPKQNAPLNFRTSNSLITTRVPHYATKTTTANSVVPGLHRPNTNGVPSNIHQHDFDGPEFSARPIKHWRRQLVPTSVNATGGVTTGPSQPIGSSGRRNATVGLLMDRPGAVTYVGDASCKCVSQPGNSYTISEHFLEVPKNKGTIVENQGVIVINNGYENGGYENGGYEINTGIYNTKCVGCNPQNNVIKSASSLLSRAYYSDTTGYLKSRCKTYQQNASINRTSGVTYLGPNGQHIWATSSANGSQVYQTNDIYKPRVNPHACGGSGASGASTVIFKPNNYQYSVQGAVDSSTRIEKLKLNTINTNANSLRSAFGNEAASACRFTGSADTPYFLKNKYQPPICSETNLISRYRQNKRICSL